MDYSPWNSLGQNTGVGSHSILQGIFLTQGLNPGLPYWQEDSLPAELPGKLKNTGVGSLSLLQQIFPTQETNRSLLNYMQILYQLSYQGNPLLVKAVTNISLYSRGRSTDFTSWWGSKKILEEPAEPEKSFQPF